MPKPQIPMTRNADSSSPHKLHTSNMRAITKITTHHPHTSPRSTPDPSFQSSRKNVIYTIALGMRTNAHKHARQLPCLHTCSTHTDEEHSPLLSSATLYVRSQVNNDVCSTWWHGKAYFPKVIVGSLLIPRAHSRTHSVKRPSVLAYHAARAAGRSCRTAGDQGEEEGNGMDASEEKSKN